MSSNKNTRAAWLEGPSAVCPPPPEVPHPWHLILLGAPGVGKGTQADLLRQRLGACHLSTGDVFRAAARNGCDPSLAMTAALDYMRRGALAPDSTVWELVRERAACLSCRGGFILDGFPRTLGHAESLKQLMETEQFALSAVVNFELPLAEIVERLSGRRACEKCKAVYHITRPPSQTAGVRSLQRPPLSARRRPPGIHHRPHGSLRTQHRTLDRVLPQSGPAAPGRIHGSPEEICARTIAALQQRDRIRP